MIAKTLLRGFVLSISLTVHVVAEAVIEWPVTGGDSSSMRYSPLTNIMINRGVAYWQAANTPGPCDRRVFLATWMPG